MPIDDIRSLRFADIRIALGLLSRLPVRVSDDEYSRAAAASWAFPVAGAVIACLVAVLASLLLVLDVPAPVAAALALASQIIMTGAMHEDGLADSADGLWGGWTTERRLEIMKDSHIGSYGVLALGLSLLIRFSALSALFAAGHVWAPLLIGAAASRVPMVVLMHWLDHARKNGLSHSVGRPGKHPVGLALGIAVILAFALTGVVAFVLFILLCLTTFACSAIASARIGGQTGDILGATQQVSEITILVVLAACCL